MAMFSENAQKVLTFLQGNPTVDMTSKELAKAAEIPTRSITGVLNSLVKKGFVIREEVAVGEDTVKFIRLTDAGQQIDPLAEQVINWMPRF